MCTIENKKVNIGNDVVTIGTFRKTDHIMGPSNVLDSVDKMSHDEILVHIRRMKEASIHNANDLEGEITRLSADHRSELRVIESMEALEAIIVNNGCSDKVIPLRKTADEAINPDDL